MWIKILSWGAVTAAVLGTRPWIAHDAPLWQIFCAWVLIWLAVDYYGWCHYGRD